MVKLDPTKQILIFCCDETICSMCSNSMIGLNWTNSNICSNGIIYSNDPVDATNLNNKL